MHRTSFVAFALAPLLMSLTTTTAGHAAGPSAAYHPVIDPANFQASVNHPYFPLIPGTAYHYVEKHGPRLSDDSVTVTHGTKRILGVSCVVVHDRLTTKGVVVEDTYDWYAQDRQGNVWYFGEDSKEFHANGKVSTEGSWEAGVGGAQPGIIMKARLVPGEPYRQEYRAGEAEDMGQIIALHDSVSVPYGSFSNCVRIREWSLIERGRETKWYAKGVGFVRGEGGGESVVLVSVTVP